MLSRTFTIKKTTPRSFQVLFLRNDSSQEVEVHESKDVDFLTVQERLERGESVFITSKASQKVKTSEKKSANLKTRLVNAFSVGSS